MFQKRIYCFYFRQTTNVVRVCKILRVIEANKNYYENACSSMKGCDPNGGLWSQFISIIERHKRKMNNGFFSERFKNDSETFYVAILDKNSLKKP